MKFQPITIAIALFSLADLRLLANARLHASTVTNTTVAAARNRMQVLRTRKLVAGFDWEPYLIYNGAGSGPEMTVLWKSDGTSCNICWGGSYPPATCDSSPGAGPLGGNHYQITINSIDGSDLDPNTKYYYRVNCGAGSIDGEFITPPGFLQDAKILAYGDTRDNPDTHSNVAKCMLYEDCNPATPSEYATLALHVGDWVGNGKCMSEWDDEIFPTGSSYNNLRKFMRNVPINGCRGNHENSGSCSMGSNGDFNTLFDDVFPYPFVGFATGSPTIPPDTLSYSFDYGNIHTSVLDQYDSSGSFSEILTGSNRFKWLSDDLDSAIVRGFRWKVVVMHRAIYSANPNRDDLSNDLQLLFESKDVNIIVVVGHDHFYARAEVGPSNRKVHHITTGGGGAPLYKPDPPGLALGHFKKTAEVHHYCRFDAKSDYLCFEAIDITGNVFDIFEIGTAPVGYDHCLCQQDSDCGIMEDCSSGRCAPGTWTQIFFEDFEPSGWGVFNDGGADAALSVSNPHSPANSVRIQDTGHVYSDSFDVSNYDRLRVDFWFYAEDIEDGEDFLLEYSQDGVSGPWIEVRSWVTGTDFETYQIYHETVNFDSASIDVVRIRFRCRANGNSDDIYLDDITLSGQASAPSCGSNPDCDDGLWCNGVEICDAGSCQPSGSSPCTGGSPACDEVSDTCVECLNDSYCTSPGEVCNPATKTCVDCQLAIYDSGGSPACNDGASPNWCCSSGILLDGRGNGQEVNFPNTLDGCSDGTSGTYHEDESNDGIKIRTTDGSNFAPGKEVQVIATVWAWGDGSQDSADFYYTVDADATNPSWQSIGGTILPLAGEQQELKVMHTLLPGGSRQAVRVNFRYQGSNEVCPSGAYDDTDDLVFAVTAGCSNNDDCDNDLYCDGVESCIDGSCQDGSDPCDIFEVCDEGSDVCVQCLDNSNCADPLVCDTGSNNTCVDCLVDADCDDGIFCNGTETCSGGACQSGSDPCPGQKCKEDGGSCVDCLVDADCDDGIFCNGTETCSGGTCQSGSDPCPGQICKEDAEICAQCLYDDDCIDNGVFCDGDEVCSNGSCTSSGDPCQQHGCDLDVDGCYVCTSNDDCPDDTIFCNGDGICDGGYCTTSGDPCPDDGIFCNGAESCDEASRQCVSSGDPCPEQICNENGDACVDCLDDPDCTDSEVCNAGACVAASTWQTVVANHDFETNWGVFNDGGNDAARRSEGSDFSHSGQYSLRIRDNSGMASSVYTDTLDVSAYSKLRVHFFYRPWSMDNNNEDFFLEFTLNGPSGSWEKIHTWRRDTTGSASNTDSLTHFLTNTENVWYDVEKEFPNPALGTSGGDFRLRFRCDASGNKDRIYLDEIEISGHG